VEQGYGERGRHHVRGRMSHSKQGEGKKESRKSRGGGGAIKETRKNTEAWETIKGLPRGEKAASFADERKKRWAQEHERTKKMAAGTPES